VDEMLCHDGPVGECSCEPSEVELHEWDCGGTVLSVEDGMPDGVLGCDTCEWEVVLDS